MSNNKTHNRISELIQLIEINHNRMVLNESSFDLDVAQMRSHVLELYTCLDQLALSKVQSSTNQEEKEESTKKEERQNIEHITISEPITHIDPVTEMPDISAPEMPIIPSIPPIQTPRFTPEPIEAELDEKEKTETENLQSSKVDEKANSVIEAVKVVFPEIVTPESPKAPIAEVETPKPVESEPVVPEPVMPEPIKEEPAPEVPVAEIPTVEKTTPPSRPEKKPAPDGDVFDQLRKKKLDSIKKGISIGKRYEIQNALFENDAEAYNHAIEQLDNSEDLNNASHLLSAYAKRYGWDPENALVDELFLLLQRRYVE